MSRGSGGEHHYHHFPNSHHEKPRGPQVQYFDYFIDTKWTDSTVDYNEVGEDVENLVKAVVERLSMS